MELNNNMELNNINKHDIIKAVTELVEKEGLRPASRIVGCSHTTLWTFIHRNGGEYRNVGVPKAVQRWLGLEPVEQLWSNYGV